MIIKKSFESANSNLFNTTKLILLDSLLQEVTEGKIQIETFLMTNLILLDSLLQEVSATESHIVFCLI